MLFNVDMLKRDEYMLLKRGGYVPLIAVPSDAQYELSFRREKVTVANYVTISYISIFNSDTVA